jgi:hypothetical protein
MHANEGSDASLTEVMAVGQLICCCALLYLSYSITYCISEYVQ